MIKDVREEIHKEGKKKKSTIRESKDYDKDEYEEKYIEGKKRK